jgi:hypothetical protein
MKRYLGLAALTLFVVFLVVYSRFPLPDDSKQIDIEQSTNQVNPEIQRNVDEMNSMEFYEDQTTGMCFATVWIGVRSNGGPTMAQVDCELTNGGIPFWSTINEIGE